MMWPKPPGRRAMTGDAAEAIGLKALIFIAEEERRLSRFLTETGLSPDALGSKAGEAETLAAVLGHLLEDESMLLVFAAGAALEPGEVHAAHALLGGASSWEST